MQVKKLMFAPRTGLALSLALNLILTVRLFTATDSDVCDCGVSIANKNENDNNTTSKLEPQTIIQQTPKEEEQRDFYTIGIATGTDKVQAQQTFKKCQDTGKEGCLYPHAINESLFDSWRLVILEGVGTMPILSSYLEQRCIVLRYDVIAKRVNCVLQTTLDMMSSCHPIDCIVVMQVR